MSFRVTARTIIQLGAELISSDAVALLELIKNAFDAGSPLVTIAVVVRIPFRRLQELQEEVRVGAIDGAHADLSIEAIRARTINAIDPTAPRSENLRHSLREVDNFTDLQSLLDRSNYLIVRDTGEGMSLDTLEDVFLTIGTRSRLEARAQRRTDGSKRPILGEKGVGRLSAMRLGSKLHVESTTSGESRWNTLDIDWSVFSHDSDAMVDAIHIAPQPGRTKRRPEYSGTRIRISGLTSAWSKVRLEELVIQEFTKLTDPFTDRAMFPIQLLYNKEAVTIPRFNRLLLDNAHATVDAVFERQTDQGMRLFGKVKYTGRERAFSIDGTHLTSIATMPMHVLDRLGPFTLEIYWYNRRILTALEGIGDRRTVLRLIREWGGGIMVFRDGFRVLPYGGPDDDWLRLDRRAFASSGYKVNRNQLIGRLQLSSVENPALRDQTNREGLQDCDEKTALVSLLTHVLQNQLRTFLDQIDSEVKAREPIDIEQLDQRVESEEQQIRTNVRRLIERVPEVRNEQSLLTGINEAIARLRTLMTDVRELATSYEAGRDQLLNLAGIGVTVEVLAHELNRATEHVLRTLAEASSGSRASQPMATTLQVLEAQLKTLHKRIRVLDPLSTAGRQRREVFDVVAVVQEIVADHGGRFDREQIDCTVRVEPDSGPGRLRIRAVKGMILQVLGNLIDNSVYWLRQQRLFNPQHESRIVVVVDTETRQVSVTDNGPGVAPAMKERIFEAFVTTKPAGQGKGMGLFIGREIARYHGADLYLADSDLGQDGACNTFVLTLEDMAS